MHTRVGRGIVDKHLTILVGNPTIRKSHVHHVAIILVTLRHQEIATRTCDYLCGVVEGSHIHIQHVAQTVGSGTHAMRQVQPALRCFDGVRTLTVLHLGDGVVFALVDNRLFLNLSVRDVIHQCPADASTATSVDKTILRTGVEGVFTIHKLRVQHHITLLTLGFQVGQSVPGFQVLGTGDASSGCGSTQVARLRVVVTLSTEHAVYPTILMLCQSHIINVGSRHHIIRHGDRLIPETEVVDTIRTLGHSKVTLAVSPLNTHHQTVFPLPFNGTCVQRGITHNTLHQVRVVVLIKVVLPLQGHMFSRHHRVLVLLVNTISPLQGFVLSRKQLLMMFSQSRYLLFKLAHILFFYSFIFLFFPKTSRSWPP